MFLLIPIHGFRLLLPCVIASCLLWPGQCSGQAPERLEFAIAIHGGAGRAPEGEDLQQGRRAVMEQALKTGRSMLADGEEQSRNG